MAEEKKPGSDFYFDHEPVFGAQPRSMARSANILREMHRVEEEQARAAQTTREVREFFQDARRAAAEVLIQLTEQAEHYKAESLKGEMKDFLDGTINCVRAFVDAIQDADFLDEETGEEDDLEPNLGNIEHTLDRYRAQGTAKPDSLLASFLHPRDGSRESEADAPSEALTDDDLDAHVEQKGEEAKAPAPEPKRDPKPATKPATPQPAANKPAKKQPEAKKPEPEPAAEKPAAEKPAAEKPAVEKPAVEKPAVEKPAVEKHAADPDASAKPATDPAAADGADSLGKPAPAPAPRATGSVALEAVLREEGVNRIPARELLEDEPWVMPLTEWFKRLSRHDEALRDVLTQLLKSNGIGRKEASLLWELVQDSKLHD